MAFDALAQLVDANGGGLVDGSCASCGGDCGPGRPCAPGGTKCEPFPTHGPISRVVGLMYETIVCPDPCYQPHWEPIADSAFFVDAPRPVSNTRFVWDYASHVVDPDRGEFLFARGDGKGKGPTTTVNGLKGIPHINYNQLSMVTEIATGAASVAVSVPYRSWDGTPYGPNPGGRGLSAAGFGDMSINAKTLLMDTELFMCAMEMKTYIPVGNFSKGLGVGHVSLQPGLVFGLRLSPDTYMQANVLEWIPIAGDPNYAGAMLQWGASVNHTLWRPVKDVQLIGTMELTGMSFQDGLYTDPYLGQHKLSGQTSVYLGDGLRLFFANRCDMGVAGNFAITGAYLVREQLRVEFRFRY